MVGPCTAGKSTLVDELRLAGFNARHVAQEHSYVPDMWQRFVQPDVLIYLDVSYETSRQRRLVSWGPDWLAVQRRRLAHARQHCDLYIPTDHLTAEAVLVQVLDFLSGQEPRPTAPD